MFIIQTDVKLSVLPYWLQADAAFERHPQFHTMRVAKQSQLLGFNTVNVSSLNYAPKGPLGRSFRIGAEDELTVTMTQSVSDMTKATKSGDKEKEEPTAIVDLSAPPFLTAKANFSMSYYSNTGMVAFFQPIGYAEGDADCQFCPTARYPGSKIGAPNMLHERDVIKNIMNWRSLPVAGQLATATLPCSPQLLATRYGQTEPVNLLPETPSMLRKAPESEKDLLIGDIDQSSFPLTPEMVTSKFDVLRSQLAKPLTDR